METTDILEGKPIRESNNDTTLAMLAHVGGIFLGFVPALIIYLLKKDDRKSQYVTVQSKEALNFQITVAIAMCVSSMLIILLIGVLFIFLIWISDVVFCIIAAIKTAGGDNYRYPITCRLIK